jgi:hypothetical protein
MGASDLQRFAKEPERQFLSQRQVQRESGLSKKGETDNFSLVLRQGNAISIAVAFMNEYAC